jgi:3-hydroxybutyryl-CoA dehydrogenase
MEIKAVGVVGCGTMGAGIAQVCAQAGYRVIVSEINQSLLDRGLAGIKSRLSKAVEKGNLSHEQEISVLGRIQGTTQMSDFSTCDLVIEAAIENLDLKKKIFAELDHICPQSAILATNTSCLSVIDIAMATRRPDRVLGMHFFNPVHLMALLEIVPTIATSGDTLGVVQDLGKALGKTAVIARDTPGFIVNRLALPFILNGIRMLENGTASRGDIDNAIKLGLNHPMGPLALADLIGLDVVLFIVDSVYQEIKDSQFAAPVLLRKMVTAGWLGRKTGKGFYEYK